MATGKRGVRLLLADDHASFRESLRVSISHSDDMEVVGEAGDGETVVTLARDLRPDVVLMDFRMPGMDGAAAAARIVQQSSSPAILMTSLSFDRQYVLRSLAAGAWGYMAKEDAFLCLPRAIEYLQAGKPYLSPTVQRALRETAPENTPAVHQRFIQDVDSEVEHLLACARRIDSDHAAAYAAVYSAFLAYYSALRESEIVGDAQTWLLLSVAAFAAVQGSSQMARWSWLQEHPADNLFEDYWRDNLTHSKKIQLRDHIAGCGSCRLSWSLAAFSIPADRSADTVTLRADIAGALDPPREEEIFVAYAQRQCKVMRLASSELERLLGVDARRDWSQRQAAAGSWLGSLLGKSARA